MKGRNGSAGAAVAATWEDGPADEADAFRAPRSGTRFSDIHVEDDFATWSATAGQLRGFQAPTNDNKRLLEAIPEGSEIYVVGSIHLVPLMQIEALGIEVTKKNIWNAKKNISWNSQKISWNAKDIHWNAENITWNAKKIN